jgi:hypothetical protein
VKQLERAALQSLLLGQGPLAALLGTANPMGGTGGIFGAIGNAIAGLFGGGRAEGGPVLPGRVYPVGERGPELFVPSVAGMISPRAAGGDVRHLIELVLTPEMDARIRRVSGPQSQQISIAVVGANNAARQRAQELKG